MRILFTLSSKKALALRLKDCNNQIDVSLEQIESYRQEDNIVDQTSLDNIIRNLKTIDCTRLQGICENTRSITQEINNLVRKEIHRRKNKSNKKIVAK